MGVLVLTLIHCNWLWCWGVLFDFKLVYLDENPVEKDDEKTKQLKILASVLGSSAGIALGKRDKSKKTFK